MYSEVRSIAMTGLELIRSGLFMACLNAFALCAGAQNVELPPGFEKCTQSTSARQTAISFQQFKGCSSELASEEYGYVTIDFDPPSESIPFAELKRNQRKSIEQSIKNFFGSKNVFGSYVLTLELLPEGPGKPGIPLDVIVLADFEFNTTSGLKTKDKIRGVNSTGYRYPDTARYNCSCEIRPRLFV